MRINWVDIIIIIYIVRAFFLGKKRGLSVELTAVIVAFLSWVVALHFYQPVSRFINTRFLVSLSAAHAIAFIGLVFGMLFLGTVLGRLLKRVMNLSFTPNVDRIGGLVLGGVRGGIITAVIVVSAVLVPADFLQDEVHTNSFFGNYLVALSPRMHQWVWAGKGVDSRFSPAEFWKRLPHKPKGGIL